MPVTRLIEFDYSMLECFQVCQRRFLFRYIEDLAPTGRQTALEFGHAVHAALNVWFQTRSPDAMLDAFIADWHRQGGDWQEDAKRTEQKALKILRGYITKYQQEPFTVIENEKPFELAIPGSSYIYIGRRDRIVDWEGAIRPMEHKTMSQLGYSTFNRFKPNLQIDGYIYSARQQYPNCYSAVVDAILVAKTKEEFARKIESRSDEEIAEFPKLLCLIGDEINRCLERGIWLPNYAMCTYYGECPYRKVCMQERALWDRIKQSDYRVSHWDPRTVENEDAATE